MKMFAGLAVGLFLGVILSRSARTEQSARPHEVRSIAKLSSSIHSAEHTRPFYLKDKWLELPVYTVNVDDQRFPLDTDKVGPRYPLLGYIHLDMNGQEVKVWLGIPLVTPQGEVIEPDTTLTLLSPEKR